MGGGGGVQTPPPPAGGGKSRGPAGRGLNNVINTSYWCGWFMRVVYVNSLHHTLNIAMNSPENT